MADCCGQPEKSPKFEISQRVSGDRRIGQRDADPFDMFKQGRVVDGLQLNEVDFPGKKEIVEAGFDVESPAQV